MNMFTHLGLEEATSLGQRIRRARKMRDLSLEQLASELGVSKVSVWGWEHDRSKPRVALLERLSAALGMSVQALVGGNGQAGLPLPEVIASFQAQIAESLGVPPQAVEIKVRFGGGDARAA